MQYTNNITVNLRHIHLNTLKMVYFHQESGARLYEKKNLEGTSSFAYIETCRLEECTLQKNPDNQTAAMLGIPADIMDSLAIEWCKYRKLHGVLGGPVGKEFGSPDCDYD